MLEEAVTEDNCEEKRQAIIRVQNGDIAKRDVLEKSD